MPTDTTDTSAYTHARDAIGKSANGIGWCRHTDRSVGACGGHGLARPTIDGIGKGIRRAGVAASKSNVGLRTVLTDGSSSGDHGSGQGSDRCYNCI